MRWIEFDYSGQGVFRREVLPEDKEFLLTHKDAFKRMWHEQTESYWVRLIVTLRSFVGKHIYPDDFWEKIGCPRSYFSALLGNCYINMCKKFALDTFGPAQEFLSSIIFVVANAGIINHIGSKSIASDPFYSSASRDAFRILFGDPLPGDKAQITAHVTLPVLSRLAAAVVALLRQWIRAGDVTLLEFYRAYRKKPYWPQPVNWCPQDSLFCFLEDECYAWDCPGEEELFQILERDKDRKKSLRDLGEILTDDKDNDNLNDCDNEDAREQMKEYNLVLSVTEHLEKMDYDLLDHDSESCPTCAAVWASPLQQVMEEVQQQILEEQSPANFWRQERIVRILRKAEKKFQHEVKERGVVLRTDLKNVPKKKGKKKSKVLKEDVMLRAQSSERKNSTVAAEASSASCREKGAAKNKATTTDKSMTTEKSMTTDKGMGKNKNAGKSMTTDKGMGKNKNAGKSRAGSGKAESTRTSTKVARAVGKGVVNGDTRQWKEKRCASCGKSDGIKLKRCALCVQKGYPEPVRYCSRECQVQDWEKRHQYVHEKDLSEDEPE